MKAWIDVDDAGRQRLTRVGSGLVLSVTPIADLGPVRTLNDSSDLGLDTLINSRYHRIAILIDGARTGNPSIRFQASAIIATHDPAFVTAMRALQDGHSYSFTIEWRRHDDVAADRGVDSLDLTDDIRGFLVDLVPLSSTM